MKNIIFIHGNSSSSRVVKPVIDIWDYDAKIIGIDLPGHGDAERNGEYSWTATNDYLISVLNNIDGDKIIIGNSAGGNHAIDIAPEIESLKCLIIVGAPPLRKPLNFQEAYAPNPYTLNYLKEEVGKDQLDETLRAAVKNQSVIPILREDFLKADPKVRSAMGADLVKPENFPDEVKIFSTLKCPKYIINGKQDITVNFSYLKQLQLEAIHPFQITYIEDCGHYPTIEKPEEFAKLLGEIHDTVFQ